MTNTTTTTVMTESGVLAGRQNNGVLAYLGVPYAHIPVGADRFQGSTEVPAWTGVRSAWRNGDVSPQPGSVRSRLLQGVLGSQSEDSLWLNIWVPAEVDGPLPVLVWIHGGAFTNGSANAASLDGDQLARASKAIVVTVNYRLGALGFAVHPELNDETTSPGLLDVCLAVDWIHKNIGAFGGNVDGIFLGGESAGSISAAIVARFDGVRLRVAGLMLFSGFQPPQPQESSVDTTELLARTLGTRVSSLAGIPAKELVRATVSIAPQRQFWPVVGTDPAPATDPGKQKPFPVLISTAADEGSFFLLEREGNRPTLSEEQSRRIVERLYPESAQRFLAECLSSTPPPDPVEVAMKAFQDSIIEAPANILAQRFILDGHPVFRMRQHTSSPLWGGWLGATHTLEVPLLFGTWDHPQLRRLYDPFTAERASRTLQAMCTRFLHHGDIGEGRAAWTDSSSQVAIGR